MLQLIFIVTFVTFHSGHAGDHYDDKPAVGHASFAGIRQRTKVRHASPQTEKGSEEEPLMGDEVLVSITTTVEVTEAAETGTSIDGKVVQTNITADGGSEAGPDFWSHEPENSGVSRPSSPESTTSGTGSES
jgi:hypothetical protein